MSEAESISSLPDAMVLNWWASEPPGRDYHHVASMARTKGIKANTNQVRRDVQCRLFHHGFLPSDRRWTSKDYLAAKRKWLEYWYGELSEIY